MCNNMSVINLVKSPIIHSKTKYIDVKYHFLRDDVSINDVTLNFIKIEFQLKNILTNL